MVKKRLDQMLVDRSLAPSREKAKALIMSGQVFVNQSRVDKPGSAVKEQDNIEVKGSSLAYVSRGGLKLEKALERFDLDLKGKSVLDIGASTGGFTDCALQNGAIKVFAVDVGYGQLDWSLRQDPRVISIERKNARYLTREDICEEVDFITIDVSFISLDKILPTARGFLKEEGEIVALIKPQFEAGREKVGKKGVVKDTAVHRDVIKKILKLGHETNLHPRGLTYSPVTGPQGNIEFLILLQKGLENDLDDDQGLSQWDNVVEKVLAEAGAQLT